MDTITLMDENNEPVEFEVIADARIAQTDYLLLGEISDDEEEAEAILVKDTSSPDDEEAVYVPVDDERETEAVKKYLREVEEIEIE